VTVSKTREAHATELMVSIQNSICTRTAADFPYHKMSKPALSRKHRGWLRRAVREITVRGARVRTMCAQAIVWKDKKQVGLLSNYLVQPATDADTVGRRVKGKREKQPIPTHPAMTMYQRYMNGVDRSDRDTADWGIVLRTSRYYLNIVYWVWSKAFGNMYQICTFIGKHDKDSFWYPYTKGNDQRYRWQMQICPSPWNVAGLGGRRRIGV